MPLTNEDIVSALVAYYKRTGVDMTSLLGDPTFMSLKTPDKIDAIKRHAADLHAGSSDDLRPRDKKTIAVEAAISAFPVVPAAIGLLSSDVGRNLLPGIRNLSLRQAVIGGLALGAATGGLVAYAKAKQSQDFRKALRANLANVARNPSTENVIGVLANSNVAGQHYSFRDHLMNKIDQLYKPEPIDEWTINRFATTAKGHQQIAQERQDAINAYRKSQTQNGLQWPTIDPA